eukprot:CAMPEP_0175678564 /NCGR_PEP_ID=MMETSP0097-20121207/23833_1 /TAXON_ID=311494 /ORGANISM="Alexandrium monilatum, Strain CCMP3105" /LENGTH=238 /DNA_ID=CAMNT_0016985359 /DNA_START=75 /DNA_END=789 /DNA_ORIENTATION=+
MSLMMVRSAAALLVLLSAAPLARSQAGALDPSDFDLMGAVEEEDCFGDACGEGGSAAVHLLQGTARFVQRAQEKRAAAEAAAAAVAESAKKVADAPTHSAKAAGRKALVQEEDLAAALGSDEDCPPGSDCATAFYQTSASLLHKARPESYDSHATVSVDANGDVDDEGAESLRPRSGMAQIAVGADGTMVGAECEHARGGQSRAKSPVVPPPCVGLNAVMRREPGALPVHAVTACMHE